MASISFQNVTKSFGDFNAVSNATFEINDGEFICLLGPSGCGKTTSLRMIAGLETPTSGRIYIGDRDVTALHPRDRKISMVFQDYALYPHMNISDNISYPLKVRGENEATRGERAQEVADVLKIGHLLDRLPAQISGGQQQRTSLARALVNPSQVYLFDEPLSNLDAKLRLEARGFLHHLQHSMGMTSVYVTHDQAEAMALATRVAVMDQGRIVQFATPMEIYRKPATTFVANFVGNPPMNLLPVEAMVADNVLKVRADGLEVADIPMQRSFAEAVAGNSKITMGVRPEHLRATAEAENVVRGKLFANENMGAEKLVTIERPDAARFTARIFTDDDIILTEDVALGFSSKHITLFDADGNRLALDDE
ncbi:Maltose/maltodextrin import ATP-binding protein MalK [Pseudovibrio sp. FO-BEG1]|uniref:ABC transporter ATP-binding protein n=1 Tax=Pseudovibrio sp. (strain FO-BEG1) TaxID=911045 RepID=UPI000238CD13|nr:ABC transporter ATP-binding protein [Pseudovibrio sp. FO-BEG1]AEV37429.1 Maltose/maltodextrin import ATP-binding protein MalK [Pseudovibrio sp. FO-BEG1]